MLIAATLVWFLLGLSGVCGSLFPKIQLKSPLNRMAEAVKPSLPFLPPLLLFALATSTTKTSPMNTKRIGVNGPFFQGWLVRVIDHEQSLSAITIVGSFSGREESNYSQHYVFSAIDSPSLKEHAEMFIDPCKVTIGKLGTPRQVLDISWNSTEGGFTFNDTNCSGHFTFPDKFTIEFDTTQSMEWSPAGRRFSFGGPEGWLGLLAPLMPCHYFVHSVGSRCSYRIRKLAPAQGGSATTSARVAGSTISVSDVATNVGADTADAGGELSGTGFAHIEGNHGTAFPVGWIWSQGIAANNTASYSLALGKFTIAGMTPTNCILYLRRANNETAVIRTTDFDSANYTTNATTGTVRLTAHSVLKKYHIEMTITPAGSVRSAFNVTVQVPTVNGFSSSPGCKETYTALTHIQFADLSKQEGASEEYSFPLSALEYGGGFLEKITQ